VITRYLDSLAEPGGDGSKAHPFRSFVDVNAAVAKLRAAGNHDQVTCYVTSGVYLRGDIVFNIDGVSLVGSGARLTTEKP